MKNLILGLLVLSLIFVGIVGCSTAERGWSYAYDRNLKIEVAPCETEVVAAALPECQKIKIVEPVLFDWDSSVIRNDQKIIIKNVAKLMKEYKDTILLIKGFASIEGTNEHNLPLSQNRADSVKTAIINEGVVSNRILTAVGLGETTNFGDKLPPNRRVLILSVDD